MWPTPSKPAVSVGKEFFRLVDAENAEILSSKMIYHLSYSLKVSQMKISLENSLVFYWFLTCLKCSGDLRLVLWEWATNGFRNYVSVIYTVRHCNIILLIFMNSLLLFIVSWWIHFIVRTQKISYTKYWCGINVNIQFVGVIIKLFKDNIYILNILLFLEPLFQNVVEIVIIRLTHSVFIKSLWTLL